ncbi:hypothetical protein ASE75_11225 [Sphingomonas sp. Leaf17]|uniref:tetratricopeptide repeat protein n=1 Tax=Sphingomonas sp. Leaf17 TaxID=1735683 RepID=UPI0006FC82A0|nr:hypothetical protein [Sphingomonas sp. Leaf17]KQM63807.1 hypothetical protein ASE75_11225 [Sphingomonas sp. Leaf17]
MGWVGLVALGGLAMAAMALLGLPRLLSSFVGAALMLGAAGYALQGRPMVPAHPASTTTAAITVDPAIIDLREQMTGRISMDGAYLIAGDAMLRSGNAGSAAQVVLGGVRKYPQSFVLWMGLGTTLAAKDGMQVSPASLFAFRQAMRLAPAHPAPPFFLGLAYVQAGEFAKAQPFWARAVRLAPPPADYYRGLVIRLVALNQILAAERGR